MEANSEVIYVADGNTDNGNLAYLTCGSPKHLQILLHVHAYIYEDIKDINTHTCMHTYWHWHMHVYILTQTLTLPSIHTDTDIDRCMYTDRLRHWHVHAYTLTPTPTYAHSCISQGNVYKHYLVILLSARMYCLIWFQLKPLIISEYVLLIILKVLFKPLDLHSVATAWDTMKNWVFFFLCKNEFPVNTATTHAAENKC